MVVQAAPQVRQPHFSLRAVEIHRLVLHYLQLLHFLNRPLYSRNLRLYNLDRNRQNL